MSSQHDPSRHAPGTDSPDDQLNRSQLADEFCKRVLDNDYESCIAMVDGEWGAGKSVFLQLCHRRLLYCTRSASHIVQFNAWQQSYTKNALLDLAYFISSNLSGRTRRKLLRIAGRTAKLIARNIHEHIAKRTLGIVNVRKLFMGSIHQSAEIEKKLETIRRELTQIAKSKRLIILIDEVDRCEPSYALHLIETVYRVFKVRGIFTIFAVNRRALEQSIRVTHGYEYDAEWYLRRFIDEQFTLPDPDIKCISDLLDVRFRSTQWFKDLDKVDRWDICRSLAFIPFISTRSIRDLEVAQRLLNRLVVAIDQAVQSGRYSGGLTPTDLISLAAALIALKMISSDGFEILMKNPQDGGGACAKLTETLRGHYSDSHTDYETMFYLDRLYALLLALGGTDETSSGRQVQADELGFIFGDAGISNICLTAKNLRLRHHNSQSYNQSVHKSITVPIKDWGRIIAQELPRA